MRCFQFTGSPDELRTQLNVSRSSATENGIRRPQIRSECGKPWVRTRQVIINLDGSKY
jgi:hypothetical protein